MPSVDVAMARSLRGGALGTLVASISSSLQRRQGSLSNIPNQVNDVRMAFSSWDNCMSVNYCKWPVIALIIIGGLIVFSVLWCIIRCAFCGLSCCCSCFHCLKCCGNCCGCCDPPRGTPHKYLDEPYIPPHHGYKSAEPMHVPRAAPSVAASAPPQYAEFDVSKKGGAAGDADSLPAMPSWESASSKKILVEDDAVELEPLKKPVPSPGAQSSQNLAVMTGGATSGTVSPVNAGRNSPYAQLPQTSPGGYPGGPGHSPDPYATDAQGYRANDPYGQPASDPYGQSSSSLGVDQGYGMAASAAAGAAIGQGRRTPRHEHDPYGQTRAGQAYPQGRSHPQDYDNTGFEQGGYGMGNQRRSPPRTGPSPAPGGYRRSPAPPADYGYGQQDQYGAGGYGRQHPPAPRRQYTGDSTRPLNNRQYSNDEPVSPSLQNNGGFDFNSGYARPQEYNYNRQPSGNQSSSSGAGGAGGYPGYKAYQPAQQGWSGV